MNSAVLLPKSGDPLSAAMEADSSSNNGFLPDFEPCMQSNLLNLATQAALELQDALREGGFLFCFIGGLAVQRWGEPRMTRDADATVLTEFANDERLVEHLLARFEPRREDARQFALRYRVLLLQNAKGVDLDIALGALPFEVRSVQRASAWKYRPEVELFTCSAEDLIVHKAFASRDQDWMDIGGICARQKETLNVPQIFEELTPLVEIKEEPAILERLEILLRTDAG